MVKGPDKTGTGTLAWSMIPCLRQESREPVPVLSGPVRAIVEFSEILIRGQVPLIDNQFTSRYL